MTKEQAIKELRICECYSVEPSVEALEIAIKALEQQPSEDCVSRLEVIKAIENYYIPNETPSSHTEHEEYGTLIPKMGLIDTISDLPPVTPTIPSTDDCVSRQAVLDKKVLIELPDGQSFYDIDPEDVKNMPPVTPTQRWIHCSERLPKKYGEYMITFTTSCSMVGGKHRFIGTAEYEVTNEYDYENNRFKGEWLLEDYIKSHYPDVQVVAWQPSIKPYEEK